MPTKAISRTEISEKLLRAKEEATTHLLKPTTLPPRFTALAASSHPNHKVCLPMSWKRAASIRSRLQSPESSAVSVLRNPVVQ